MNCDQKCISSEAIADEANRMLDDSETSGERAIALAIALRDRLEATEEVSRDFTACILAGMLVDELGSSPERSIKECVATLFSRCELQSKVGA